MDYRTYQKIRAYCWQDLATYIDTPEKNSMLDMSVKLAGGTLGEIKHEQECAMALYQCRDLTPRENAAAHLLAVISNHRAITWQREPIPPFGNEPASPLTKKEDDKLVEQTLKAIEEYRVFLPDREGDALLNAFEASAPANTPAAKVEAAPATSPSLDVFRTMNNLTADEVSITFVGDKTESGVGANNMLEISARNEKRRIAIAALDLVDRRRGSLNSQGGILLGMAQKKKLTRTESNAAKMTRLREVFRKHLGINGDPFGLYRKGVGWEPHFKVFDNRGAADERAKREAERRTDSYEQLNESGEKCSENDAANDWLKNNDPNATA